MWDEDLDYEDEQALHFLNWYSDLEDLAKPFGIKVSDRDAWRESFDQGLSARAALAEDYPEILVEPTAHIHALKAEDVAKAIDLPFDQWQGQCYGVSCAILEAGLVEGRAVYGHYLGMIAPTSMFYKRPLVPHGWIETPDGTVIDPTRWVFESAEPYLYQVKLSASKDYDEGGNVFRKKLQTPAPEFNPNDTVVVSISESSLQLFNGLLGRKEPHQRVCMRELAWLANLSLITLGECAQPLYEEIVRVGWIALIPIDNRMKILGAPAIPLTA